MEVTIVEGAQGGLAAFHFMSWWGKTVASSLVSGLTVTAAVTIRLVNDIVVVAIVN